MRPLPLLLTAAAVAGAAGCDDFATPAELTKPTVLAVVADPPIVPPGETTTLSVVMAGPDGPTEPDSVDWQLVETLPGVIPFGTITPGDGATATFTAPDPVPPQPEGAPPVSSVQATVVAGDTEVVVVKAVVAADVPSANPTIAALAVADETVGDDDEVTLTHGATVNLDVGTEPAAGEDATYAWYATVGTIDYFQSTPTSMVVRDEPGEGWIFIVVRDGRGGVAWRGVHATVE